MATKHVLMPLSLVLLVGGVAAGPLPDVPTDPALCAADTACRADLIDDTAAWADKWPHCWTIVSVILEPPFVVIHDGCIFPLPIGDHAP